MKNIPHSSCVAGHAPCLTPLKRRAGSRRVLPPPSDNALEAADSIKLAYSIGHTDAAVIAALIDYSTRGPQLDAVAAAAADLLAALPLQPRSRRPRRRRRVPASRPYVRSALKLARALRSLAAEDVPLNPQTLLTIKRLTPQSFST
jgi:hypothetical protein